MKYLKFLFLNLFALFVLTANAQDKDYYQLKIYHLKTKEQEQRVDNYLRLAYVPALHKSGVKNVGVFKSTQPDTSGQKIYVLVPFRSLEQLQKIESSVTRDKQFKELGKDYLQANYKTPPYSRIETIILTAFTDMPQMRTPKLSAARSERIYELRSYEGPTEAYYQNKVEMFNKGGEIKLFERLGFNAVFYGEVLAGSRMPNLMYMTTFNSKADRDNHWKAFGDDPEWKKLWAMPYYQNNVSKGDTFLLYPTDYSDY